MQAVTAIYEKPKFPERKQKAIAQISLDIDAGKNSEFRKELKRYGLTFRAGVEYAIDLAIAEFKSKKKN